MDLWLRIGLRGSMKPSSRERLSRNIKLLRIYRFLSERYISLVIRIWLLKTYLGWSVFCGWYSVCVQTRNDSESDGRAGVRALGHHQSPGVSSRSGLLLVNGQQPSPFIGCYPPQQQVTTASCTRHA